MISPFDVFICSVIGKASRFLTSFCHVSRLSYSLSLLAGIRALKKKEEKVEKETEDLLRNKWITGVKKSNLNSPGTHRHSPWFVRAF